MWAVVAQILIILIALSLWWLWENLAILKAREPARPAIVVIGLALFLVFFLWASAPAPVVVKP
jgi:hypothetical protein